MIKTSIAVLPFVNMSSDPENEYFSDGITEEIINALAKINELRVISRTSSFYFKGKESPIRDIARQLDVNIILEGSVRVANDVVRITAQLIEANDDFHFWSETWDRKMINIFDIQDEISVAIAEKLREQIGHFEVKDHLVEKQTNEVDAYYYSLKAKYFFNKWNPTDVKKAIELFNEAIKIDPNHTESYIGLADAYGFMATTAFMPLQEAWMKAVENTNKALALNPEHPGVHYQLANISFFTDCNFYDAAQHTLKAIALRPSHPEAQQFMAFLYMLNGDLEKAQKHLQFALDIDPLNQETLFYKTYYLYRTLEFEKAISLIDDLLSKNPKNLPALIVKLYALLMMRKPDEALHVLQGLDESLVIADERLGIECLAYILKNDKSKVNELLPKLIKEVENPTSFQAHTYLFLAYVNMGENEKAFDWLEKALEYKSSIFLLSFSDPLASGIKNEERYYHFHKLLYPPIRVQNSKQQVDSSLLSESQEKVFVDKLIHFIEQEHPYLNPSLTLRFLAEQVEIHPNQLSWLLNQKIGKNYNEFINYYRIEHFKKLVKDPTNSHISLIGLAYESGFNSKTVFNTFFKKQEGITPSQFMKGFPK